MALRIDCDSPQRSQGPKATASGRSACWTVDLPDVRRTVVINFADAEQRADSPRDLLTVAPRNVVVVPTGNAAEKLRK